MRTRRWEVKTPSGGFLDVQDFYSKGFIWSDWVGGNRYTQALLACKDSLNFQHYLGDSVLGIFQRYPLDDQNDSMYCYVLVENAQQELTNLAEDLLHSNELVTVKSGPAVLDVPIIGLRNLSRVVTVPEYLSVEVFPRRIFQSELELLRMYEVGILQYGLFPSDLKASLGWYKTLLDSEQSAYSRVAERLAVI